MVHLFLAEFYNRNSVSDPEEAPAIVIVAAERGGRGWCIGLGPVITPGGTSGEMDGERLARGDKLGEKLGDMAGVVKVLSWLMGERGSDGIGANCPEPRTTGSKVLRATGAMDRGATLVMSGGGSVLTWALRGFLFGVLVP